MKQRYFIALFFLQVLFLINSVFAQGQNGSKNHRYDEADMKSASAPSNGCPDSWDEKQQNSSKMVMAADGTTAPCPVKIRIAKPLQIDASDERKWTAFNRAVLESDFKRLIVLFTDCAVKGDGLCQYLLAQGVAEWRNRTDVAKNPKYNEKFELGWLQKAFRSHKTLRLVAGDYASLFNTGYESFPEDEELSRCWLGVANVPQGSSRRKLRNMANVCEKLSIKRYGIQP